MTEANGKNFEISCDQRLGTAQIGGLTFSTVVTLLMLPTIYVLMDDLRNWARVIVRSAR